MASRRGADKARGVTTPDQVPTAISFAAADPEYNADGRVRHGGTAALMGIAENNGAILHLIYAQ